METTKRLPQGLQAMWLYWSRSAANLFRMGHCAPTVMQTLLDLSGTEREWLVRLSAGMPGGIANTGFECGAVTSPLVLMGLRYGLHETEQGLPVIFDRGHMLCRQFLDCHKTMMCREIRKDDRFPKRCIRPVCLAPQLFMASTAGGNQDAIPPGIRDSYRQIYTHWLAEDFHCAQAVLKSLDYRPSEDQEIFDATAAFAGGTLCLGMTCSALAAGIMAIGLQTAEIENSPLRVARMLFRMTFGGDAFDEGINKFNRPMNTGYRMSRWFKQEFGSTQCQRITECDFSTDAGVNRYITGDGVARCKQIASQVAQKVRQILAGQDSVPAVTPAHG